MSMYSQQYSSAAMCSSMSRSRQNVFEEALQSMQQSCSEKDGVPILVSLQRLSNTVNVTQHWKESDAKRLCTALELVNVLDHASNQEQLEMELSRLLNIIMDKWSDHLVYSAMSNSDNQGGLMDCIYRLTISTSNSTIQRDAIVVISKWWQIKERIDLQTSSDGTMLSKSTVWIEQKETLEKVALIAMNVLLSDDANQGSQYDCPPTIDCERRTACAVVLSNLLKHNVSGWLYSSAKKVASSDAVTELCKLLLSESARLHDNNLAAASSQFGLSCLSLLCWIQKRHHQPIPELDTLFRTTPIVEHVVRVALPTKLSTPRGPRWTYETCQYSLRQTARDLLQAWSLAGQTQAMSAFGACERLWRTFCEETWNIITSGIQNDAKLEQALPGLLLLHKIVGKATTSDILTSLLSSNGLEGTHDQAQQYRHLLTSLVSLCCHDNGEIAASSAALFKTLLCHRSDLRTQDEASRAVWNTIETLDGNSVLYTCMEAVVNLVNRGSCESNILCMLNVVQDLTTSQKVCQRFLGQLSLDQVQERIDGLLKVMSPRKASRNEQQMVEDSTTVEEEETPKMGNLESTTKSFFGESRTKGANRSGINVATRVSVATALARLAWCPLVSDAGNGYSYEQTATLQAKIQSAVNDFVFELPSLVKGLASTDLTRRMLTLNTFMASSCLGGEDLVSSVLFEMEENRVRALLKHSEEASEHRRQLQKMTAKVEQLEHERDNCRAEITASRVVHEREINRVRLQASADAARMVELHATERSKAESHAKVCENRMAQAEANQREAEKAVEAARACEDLIRSDLCVAEEKVKELEEEIRAEQSKVEESESRNQETAQELRNTEAQLHTMNEIIKSKDREISKVNATAKEAHNLSADLQDNLEDTYATLVALAHCYQEKEKETEKAEAVHGKNLTKMKSKLETEQNRNEILEESEQRLHRENDRLLRKLTRAKEKLEEERRDRQEELERRKRHGPVSYINQLHDESLASEKSSGRSRYASGSGKENSTSHRTKRLYR